MLQQFSWNTSGTSSVSSFPQDPTQKFFFLADDFIGTGRESTTAYVFGQHSWATSSQNAGNFSTNGGTIASSVNHPGVLQLGSGANNNDASSIYTGQTSVANNPAFLTGSGAIRMRGLVNVNALSNGTDNAQLVLGLSDSPAWSAATNAIRIMYQYETDQTHWILHTQKAGVSTTTVSTVVVTTGWHWLEIDVNAAGTSVTATVDSVSLGTNATNIPVVGMPYRFDFRKTLGTTAYFFGVDYMDLSMDLAR